MSTLKEQKQTPSERLASAADELSKAAASFDDTASFQGMVDAIDNLKASADAKLNTSNQKIGDLNNMVSQVVAKMDRLNFEVMMMNQNLVLNRKMESLAWAIANVATVSFQYYTKQSGSSYMSEGNSKDLVRDVLLLFRKGSGAYAPSDEEFKKGGKEFRDKFSDVIHGLTGVKPRLVFHAQCQQYLIYYE